MPLFSTIALIGNPNSGKTTLFNSLTNDDRYTGNWAGVTVEMATGAYSFNQTKINVVDLPGVYSLVTTDDCAADEQVTLNFIHNSPEILYINVIDAGNLQKDLYLTLQLLESNKPVIVVVNFIDILASSGVILNLAALAKQLNCPVIPISSLSNPGLNSLQELKEAVNSYNRAASTSSINYPALPNFISNLVQFELPKSSNLKGLRVLEGDVLLTAQVAASGIDINNIKQLAQSNYHTALDIAIATLRHHKIADILQAATRTDSTLASNKSKLTTALDKILLHKYFSLPLFFLIMYLMFGVSINIGGYLQEYFELYSALWFVQMPTKILTALHSPSWLITLLAEGVGKGLNVTLTFIPVLTMMFISLAFVENVGYMARAAFIVERVMRIFGLPGKSFVPMIVGFGCNVPAIMGSRTISNYKERILTVMMLPFMSCSARLAIYAIFVAAFYPRGGHNIIFGLYLIGIAAAFLTGLLLRTSVLSNEPASSSLVEFPMYRIPSAKSIFKQTAMRLKRFCVKAGIMIIPFCIAFGFIGNERLATIGRKVTPIFAPMGIAADNWPATVGLLSGLVAKETLIGTLNALYEDKDNLSLSTELSDNARNKMVDSFGSSHAAFAYLLFTLLYFPCISVVAAIAKELNVKWAVFSVLWTTTLAYCIATIYYQVASGNIKNGLLVSTLLLISCGIFKLNIFNKKDANIKHKYLPTKIVLR